MIEQDIFTALKNVCDRVYPIKMPQNVTYPAITYMVIYDGQDQAANGNLMSRSVRFQVDVWAVGYSEAKTLKDEIVNEVIGLKGGSISAQDLYEDDLKLHRQLIDFEIKRI